jgi:hypothetical protein
MDKKDELHDISTYYTKFLKYDTKLTLNRKLLPHLTKKTPIGVTVKSAFDVMDYCFTTALNCNFELVWVKMCYKLCCKIKNIKHDL